MDLWGVCSSSVNDICEIMWIIILQSIHWLDWLSFFKKKNVMLGKHGPGDSNGRVEYNILLFWYKECLMSKARK